MMPSEGRAADATARLRAPGPSRRYRSRLDRFAALERYRPISPRRIPAQGRPRLWWRRFVRAADANPDAEFEITWRIVTALMEAGRELPRSSKASCGARSASSRTVRGELGAAAARAAPEWRGDDYIQPWTVGAGPGPVTPSAAVPDRARRARRAQRRREDGGYLVVLTPCETHEVGDRVLARAMRPEIKPINRWDLVPGRVRRAAARPRAHQEREPLDGRGAARRAARRRLAAATGPVLTRATALNRLAATRLGIDVTPDDSAVDAAALLEWTTDAAAVASFLQLRDAERVGFTGWLAESVGPVARRRLRDGGRGQGSPTRFRSGSRPRRSTRDGGAVRRINSGDAARRCAAWRGCGRTERYLGGRVAGRCEVLQRVRRGRRVAGHPVDRQRARAEAAALCERAEAILAELADGQLATEPGRLEPGARSGARRPARRVRRGAQPCTACARLPARPASWPECRTRCAWSASTPGSVTRDGEIRAAQAAVRLARWLAAPEEPTATLADAATRMLRSWGVGRPGARRCRARRTSRVPGAWRRLREAVRRWQGRAAPGSTEAFARKLAAWTEASSATDGLLLVENLLDRIARPVAQQRPPVIVVLDGMTAAVGCELAEEITGRGGWLEVGRRPDGREPPSPRSRRSPRCRGPACSPVALQSAARPRNGLASPRSGAGASRALFHKADLRREPGQPLAAEVRDAIADPETVVGVVLNTIDDTLDKGSQAVPAALDLETSRTCEPCWTRRAGRAGRSSSPPTTGMCSIGARPRRRPAREPEPDPISPATGPARPGPGRSPSGPACARRRGERSSRLWTRRSITRRGRRATTAGASPAEVVVPAITLLPSESLVPRAGIAYDAAGHAPSWWDPPAVAPRIPRTGQTAAAVDSAAARSRQRQAVRRSGQADPVPDDSRRAVRRRRGRPAALLAPQPAAAVPRRLARGSSRRPGWPAQRQFVRRAPDDAQRRRADRRPGTGRRPLTIAEAAERRGRTPVPHVRLPGAGHPAAQRRRLPLCSGRQTVAGRWS